MSRYRLHMLDGTNRNAEDESSADLADGCEKSTCYPGPRCAAGEECAACSEAYDAYYGAA